MDIEDYSFSIEKVLRTVEGLSEQTVLEYAALLSAITDEPQLAILTQRLLELHKIPPEHAKAIEEAAIAWKSRSLKRKHYNDIGSSTVTKYVAFLKKAKITAKQEKDLDELYRKSYNDVVKILELDNSEQDKLTILLSLLYGNTAVPWEKQLVSKIKSYWSDNDFVYQLLLSIGKLDLPHVPSPKLYSPKSKYLKHDLPCSVRQNALDFTILPGDLDNPNIMPEVVQHVISSIDSTINQDFFHTNLLLGTSAIGKTKALYDIATEFYTIFINGNYAEGGRVEMDVMNMMHKIGEFTLQSREMPQEIMEDKCTYEILLVSTSRVVALLYLLTVGAIQSPSDWRNVQLNGLSTYEFEKFLSPIQYCIRRQFPSTHNLQEIQTKLCKAHLDKFKRPICVAIDEANVFIQAFPKHFKSQTSNADRPLWTLLGRTLSSINTIALLISGTTIRLSNEEVLVSSIAKEVGKQFHVRTNFRHTTPEETSKYLSRIFINLPQNAHDLICSRLYGRMRYVTTIASRIEADPNSDPESIVVQFIDELQSLTSLGKRWTIPSSLQRFYEQYGVDCIRYLQEILLSVYLKDGILRYDTDQIDWLIGGICRVVTTPLNTVYKFDEPLVIECIEKFLDLRPVSVTDCLSRYMLDDSLVNASAKGVLLDSIVQLTLMKNPSPSFIGAILPDLPINIDSDYSVVHSTLTSYLKNPVNKILAPSMRTGPDVIYFPDPSVMILFSNCTTTVNKSVPGTKVNDSVSTTNISNICSMKKDGTRVVDPRLDDSIFSSLEEISHLIKNGLKHVVRVHIVLPGASKTVLKDIFNPGHYSSYSHIITYNTPNKFDTKSITFREHTVSIDSSCLELSALVSPKTLENLLRLYPTKKKRTVKGWTKVAAPDLTTKVSLGGANLPLNEKTQM